LKKLLTTALLFAALAAPAQANHIPKLTTAEACRVAGKVIHTEFSSIVPGSSRGHCYTQARPGRPDIKMVTIFYMDRARHWWETTMTIREHYSGYRYRILSDHRVRRPH
jgi:hypothetical protein